MKETMKSEKELTVYNLRIPIEVKRQLQTNAIEKNQSLNLYLNEVLNSYIESSEKRKSVILKRSWVAKITDTFQNRIRRFA